MMIKIDDMIWKFNENHLNYEIFNETIYMAFVRKNNY